VANPHRPLFLLGRNPQGFDPARFSREEQRQITAEKQRDNSGGTAAVTATK
jgi:hypothetical protein